MSRLAAVLIIGFLALAIAGALLRLAFRLIGLVLVGVIVLIVIGLNSSGVASIFTPQPPASTQTAMDIIQHARRFHPAISTLPIPLSRAQAQRWIDDPNSNVVNPRYTAP